MAQVIVVPETSDFEQHVSHKNLVWINKKLGKPRLKEREANYLAPLWVKGTQTGVNRLYHILGVEESDPDTTEIRLGNSFVLKQVWSGAGQHRRFEYHKLSDFGMVEICPGLLFPLP